MFVPTKKMGYVEQPAQYAQDANGVVVNGMGGVMPVVGGISAPPVGVMTTGITRVYVGNLSWETEWQDLKDHMRTAGEVSKVFSPPTSCCEDFNTTSFDYCCRKK